MFGSSGALNVNGSDFGPSLKLYSCCKLHSSTGSGGADATGLGLKGLVLSLSEL